MLIFTTVRSLYAGRSFALQTLYCYVLGPLPALLKVRLTPPQRRTFVETAGGETDPAPGTMGPVSYSSETYDLVSRSGPGLVTGAEGRGGGAERPGSHPSLLSPSRWQRESLSDFLLGRNLPSHPLSPDPTQEGPGPQAAGLCPRRAAAIAGCQAFPWGQMPDHCHLLRGRAGSG